MWKIFKFIHIFSLFGFGFIPIHDGNHNLLVEPNRLDIQKKKSFKNRTELAGSTNSTKNRPAIHLVWFLEKKT